MSVFSNRIKDAHAEAGAYTEAVLGLLGSRDPWDVLDRGPDSVVDAAHGLTDAQLRHPEAPGKWSILAVLRHMLDSELVWGYRLHRIAAENRPEIHGYDQDLWADALDYAADSPATVLEEFAALRRMNLRFLRSLPTARLKRAGVHTERGDESIEHLIRMYAGHDLLHRAQIERIRKTLA
jgi:uncharacterized damage-inducible protein DinB